jgi:hypothetical protein
MPSGGGTAMVAGSVHYSIKYDLGGSIRDFEGFYREISKSRNAVLPDQSLSIFNLSYLSRVQPSMELGSTVIAFEGQPWTLAVRIEPVGVVTLNLTTQTVEAADSGALSKALLGLHDAFLKDKNLDYLIYLSQSGSLTGRLQRRKVPEQSGHLNFRAIVDDLRRLAQPYLRARTMYHFHDFRPIFLIDGLDTLPEPDLAMLLQLSTQVLPHAQPGTADQTDRTGRFHGRSWAFAVDRANWTHETADLFEHCHTSWYLAQMSIFEMHDLDDAILAHEGKIETMSSQRLRLLLSVLQKKKSQMFSELFSALNSDFIVKNSLCRDELDFLKRQFGIDVQIAIVEKYTDRISNFLTDHYSFVESRHSQETARNTNILEVLFLINTVVGIGALSQTLFATGLSNSITLDAPRLVAFSLIAGSVGLYLFLILAGRILTAVGNLVSSRRMRATLKSLRMD